MSNSIIKLAFLCVLAGTCTFADAANKGDLGGKPTRPYSSFVAQPKNGGKSNIKKIDSRARIFYIESKPYYCYNGVYYQFVSGKGYEEIEMPANVVVQDLPYGARRVYINGASYYNADGMWFQQVGNEFLIIKQPKADTEITDTVPSKKYRASFGY